MDGKADDADTNLRVLIFALLALACGHMLSTLLRTIPAISLDVMAADFRTPPQTLASLTSIYHFAFAASQIPVGAAMEYFNQHYAELFTDLTEEREEARWAAEPDVLSLSELWTAAHDARSYVVLGDPEWEAVARANGAGLVEQPGASNLALAVAAAEAHLGRPVDPHAADHLVVPGRLERRREQPLEIWDGAHNLDGVGYLLGRAPSRDYVIVASILADKDAARMLAALSALGRRLVATSSSSPRALPADELARLAAPWFDTVESGPDPVLALSRARELAGPEGAVLVTGSLYLLADLSVRIEHVPWPNPARV